MRFLELVREQAGFRFLEELGTEPRVYYLLPRARAYPAPAEPMPVGGRGEIP